MTTERLARFIIGAGDDVVAAGLDWYPAHHDTAAGIATALGISRRQAAGIIAVLSPSMEASTRNINAALAVGEQTWDITTIVPGLTNMPRRNVVKALRIRDGEDPADVLDPRTAPKTTCFFHNIHDPNDDDWITIDGRIADVIANEMRPWKLKRGIESARLRRGGTTRYEEHENIVRAAARRVTRRGMPMHGVEAQAVLWCQAKALELHGLTQRGTPRKNGPHRVGQSYTQLRREVRNGSM
jgi:hypothetical protein